MVHHYRDLINSSRTRVAAFERAITHLVRAGDTVTDIGCGIGTFTMFACRAGAKRVYAVEHGSVLEFARSVVRRNGYADHVEFLPGISHALEVRERADVVIYEDYDVRLLNGQVLATLRDIEARWLLPGGRLIPNRARLFVAVAEDIHAYQYLDCLENDCAFGLDFRDARLPAFSTWMRRQLPEQALLVPPLFVGEVDLLSAKELRFRADGDARALRSGTIHGVMFWFDLSLGEEWLSSGPGKPKTGWDQLLFPFSEPIRVEEGESISYRLQVTPTLGQDVFTWRVKTSRALEQGCTLFASPVSKTALSIA